MTGARPWRLRAEAAFGDSAEILSHLLEARNVPAGDLRDRFLSPSLEDLTDGTDLPDLDRAATLIVEHLDQGVIGICGDYDADGTCATALLAGILHAMGGKVLTVIPDRFTEGYGMQPVHVERLVSRGATLIVTVDNGMTSYDAVDTANRLEIPCIVTDHHQPGETSPNAAAIVNPAVADTETTTGPICGTGVAFYLCAAVRRMLRDRQHPGAGVRVGDWLDLVALATVADMVPLRGANRILVHRGLHQINRKPRLWVRSLAQVCHNDPKQIDAEALAFRLGPRINAAGRVDHADAALRLLLSTDPSESQQAADNLDTINRRRRSIEEKVENEVLQVAHACNDGLALVAASDNWHPGVVGLAASRLTRRFQVPALVGHVHDGLATCSARSVDGFDLYAALALIRDRFHRFGGHPAAAGLTLPVEELGFVRDHLQKEFSEAFPDGYRAPLWIDAMIKVPPDQELLTMQSSMEPFGRGNEKPVYALMDVRVSGYRMNGGHLGLRLKGTADLSCVAWNQGDRMPLPDTPLHLAFTLGPDTYRGGVQMMLVDFASGDPFAQK